LAEGQDVKVPQRKWFLKQETVEEVEVTVLKQETTEEVEVTVEILAWDSALKISKHNMQGKYM
jgi:hypothetical protein